MSLHFATALHGIKYVIDSVFVKPQNLLLTVFPEVSHLLMRAKLNKFAGIPPAWHNFERDFKGSVLKA